MGDENKEQKSKHKELLKNYTPTLLYFLARSVTKLLVRIFNGLEIVGQENIPAKGGVIIAPSHTSNFDPPLMVATNPVERILYSLGKEELLNSFWFRLIHRHISMIPIKRGATDMEAFKTAIAVLKTGEMLLMFPEGTRSRDGKPRRPKAGVAMLSCATGVPIVPAKIFNSGELCSKIKVVYGKPIYPPGQYSKEDYQKIVENVMSEIAKLS